MRQQTYGEYCDRHIHVSGNNFLTRVALLKFNDSGAEPKGAEAAAKAILPPIPPRAIIIGTGPLHAKTQ